MASLTMSDTFAPNVTATPFIFFAVCPASLISFASFIVPMVALIP